MMLLILSWAICTTVLTNIDFFKLIWSYELDRNEKTI